MPAGQVRRPRPGARAVPGGVQQGTQPGEGAHHVGTVDRDVQHGAQDVEEEPDVGLRGLGDVGDVTGHGLVGEPHVDPAVVLGRTSTKRLVSPGIGMCRPAVRVPRLSGRRTRWVPREGRIRTPSTRPPAHTPAALTTARARISPSSPVSSSRTLAPVEVSSSARTRVRTRAPRAAAVRGQGGHQPGVVGEPSVPRQQPAAQSVPPQCGREVPGLHRAEAARRGKCGPGRAGGQAQRVTGVEPGPRQGRLAARDQRGQGGQYEGLGCTRWGAVRSISTPRSTALSWATSSRPEAR